MKKRFKTPVYNIDFLRPKPVGKLQIPFLAQHKKLSKTFSQVISSLVSVMWLSCSVFFKCPQHWSGEHYSDLSDGLAALFGRLSEWRHGRPQSRRRACSGCSLPVCLWALVSVPWPSIHYAYQNESTLNLFQRPDPCQCWRSNSPD